MSASYIRNIIIGLLLLLAQVVLFNRIYLFGCATPLLLVYALIVLPVATPRWLSLLLAFFMGLVSDMFTNTPGVAAITLTFIAFIQPPLLRAIIADDEAHELLPSLRSLGPLKFISYSLILTFLACALTFILEEFSFSRWLWLLYNILGSTALTYIFIFTFELIRRR